MKRWNLRMAALGAMLLLGVSGEAYESWAEGRPVSPQMVGEKRGGDSAVLASLEQREADLRRVLGNAHPGVGMILGQLADRYAADGSRAELTEGAYKRSIEILASAWQKHELTGGVEPLLAVHRRYAAWLRGQHRAVDALVIEWAAQHIEQGGDHPTPNTVAVSQQEAAPKRNGQAGPPRSEAVIERDGEGMDPGLAALLAGKE